MRKARRRQDLSHGATAPALSKKHRITHDSHLEGGYSMVAEATIKIQRPNRLMKKECRWEKSEK
jgi:hypothetical protein